MNGEMQWVLLIVGGFFLGGIMFSYQLPRLLKDVDICALSDDRNPGAANVFMKCDWKMGLLCVFLDILKGFIPVFMAYKLLDIHSPLFTAVMIAPVLGHAVAPFQKTNGGKCIATSFGVMTATLPFSCVCFVLAGLYILFSTVIRLKPMPRRSVVVFALFGIISVGLSLYKIYYSFGMGCLLIACLVIAKHIKRTSEMKTGEST